MNYFAPRPAAERYEKGRPFFHPLVIGRVRERLSLAEPLPLGLDVCCGTGLSSLALKEVAARVVGLDLSAEMLAHAPRDAGVDFCRASAENMPFGGGAYDVLSVCQGFHWLDRGRFLAEARRVLRADGLLVVYDDYMTGQMEGGEGFRSWHAETYRKKFPAPPRAPLSFTEEQAEAEGFRRLLAERFEHSIAFTPEALVHFVTSQSNVIAAVEGGGLEIGDARRWLEEGVRPFFAGRGSARFVFEAVVWCLRRAP